MTPRTWHPMRAPALLTAALALLLVPSLARAGGINLAWGSSCWPDNPSNSRSFACTSNAGGDVMTASFVLDQPFPDFSNVRVLIGLRAASTTLPDWWNVYNPGACRLGGLAVSADFTALVSSCADPWAGQATPAILYYHTHADDPQIPVNEARLVTVAALTTSVPLDAGLEYLAMSITLRHVQSVGTGSCAGCSTPTSIVLDDIDVANAAGHGYRLSVPMGNSCLAWQGQDLPCNVTPVPNRTWGQVKSFYR